MGTLGVSPIDLALWDIRARAEGFKGVKIKVEKPTLKEDVARLEMVRKAVGDSFCIMVDANLCWDAEEAIRRAQAFESLGIYWLEEPLEAFDVPGACAPLQSSTKIPVAVGESLDHRWAFEDYAHWEAARIFQPDVVQVGGPSEWLCIARLAAEKNLSISPHFLAELHLQLVAAIPYALFVEYLPQLDTVLIDPPVLKKKANIRYPRRRATGFSGTGKSCSLTWAIDVPPARCPCRGTTAPAHRMERSFTPGTRVIRFSGIPTMVRPSGRFLSSYSKFDYDGNLRIRREVWMSQLRVRFAPSPTGYLHVGGARTALFNWLFARRHGGVFILRIEDTDVDRSREELVKGILKGLEWLGINWDEGPYRQSERVARYQEVALQLQQRKHVYPCFCSLEELKARRAQSAEDGRPWMYDGTCRRLSDSEREKRIRSGRPYALRFRVPESGMTAFEDLVQGRIEVPYSSLDDFVLLRANGQPTYHLGVVADDGDMGITHVIRGADHISNAFKQLLVYGALGVPAPQFAHLPLILGPDRTRLSKRHGATSVDAYREQGILPEALVNFLALLGWSPHESKEILTLGEMIDTFSLENISRSNAVFDSEKLFWMNSRILRSLSRDKLVPRVEKELRRSGLWHLDYGGSKRNWFRSAVELLQPRMRTLKDFSSSGRAFFAEEVNYEPSAVNKFWKDASLGTSLPELAAELNRLQSFDAESAEPCLRSFAERKGLKAGLLINASRVALMGQAVAPSLFGVMEVLGKQRVVHRLQQAGRFIAERPVIAN